MWTCIESSRLFLDRVFCRITDKDSIGCPQFEVIYYTDHKFVILTVDLKFIGRDPITRS